MEIFVRSALAIVVIAGFGLGCAERAMANRDSLLAFRQRVADSLNAALQREDSLVLMPGGLAFLNRFGVCDTLDTLPVRFSFNESEQTFRIKVRRREAYQIDLESNDHALVRDINFYLNRIWGLNLATIPGLSKTDLFAGIACGADTVDQPYVIMSDTALPWDSAYRVLVHHLIDSISGRSVLLANSYWINGVLCSGSAIHQFYTTINLQQRMYPAYVLSRGFDSSVYVIPPDFHLVHGGLHVIVRAKPVLQYEGESCDDSTLGGFYFTENQASTHAWLYVTLLETTTMCNLERTHLLGSHQELIDSMWFTVPFTAQIARFELNSNGMMHLKSMLHSSSVFSCDSSTILPLFLLVDPDDGPEDCIETFCLGGEFVIDTIYGALQYMAPGGSGCGAQWNPQPVYCIGFCDSLPPPKFCLEGVISATAYQYSQEWPYDSTEFATGLAGENGFERGTLGRWRVSDSYVYSTPIIAATAYDDTSQRIYRDAGVFSDALQMFVHGHKELNDTTRWIRTDTVTAYSPNGEPVEETNALWIPSSARFGHQGSVPVMVARNASYGTIDFESFEESGAYPDNRARPGHAGSWSYRLPMTSEDSDTLVSVVVDARVAEHGLLLRYWVRTTYNGGSVGESGYLYPAQIWSDVLDDTLAGPVPTRIAQTGAWSLYEKRIESLDSASIGQRLDIRFRNATGADTVWIDDIRIEPIEAASTCNVYDAATLRLVCAFDDQHFGVHYQYNGEGKLTRMLRETERGRRTVTEAQYHVPLVSPNDTTVFAGATRPDAPYARAYQPPRLRFDGGGGGDLLGANPVSGSLLHFTLTPEGEKISVMGSRPMTWEEFKAMDLPAIHGLRLPRIEKLRFVSELGSLDERIARLDELETTIEDPSARANLAKTRTRLETERRKLLERAGVSDEEAERVREEMATMKYAQ